MEWLLPCLLTSSRRLLAVPFLSSKGGKNIRMRKLVYGSEEKSSRAVPDQAPPLHPFWLLPKAELQGLSR